MGECNVGAFVTLPANIFEVSIEVNDFMPRSAQCPAFTRLIANVMCNGGRHVNK